MFLKKIKLNTDGQGNWLFHFNKRCLFSINEKIRLLFATIIFSVSQPLFGHLANWGSWEITKKNLDQLFPEATSYAQKKHTFSAKDVEEIEAFLGFRLYPEDQSPIFFIAIKQGNKPQQIIGVALFIDPRIAPKYKGGQIVRLEIGVAVDLKGGIKGVRVYDYIGDKRLTQPNFLNQFKNKDLNDTFIVGSEKGMIQPVPYETQESQLVANAAKEALFLMKKALGSVPE